MGRERCRDMGQEPPEHLGGKMGDRLLRSRGRLPESPECLPLAIQRSAGVQIGPRITDEIPHGPIRLLGEMQKRQVADHEIAGIVVL